MRFLPQTREDIAQPESVGKVQAFCGNFSVLIKAYSYILSMGRT